VNNKKSPCLMPTTKLEEPTGECLGKENLLPQNRCEKWVEKFLLGGKSPFGGKKKNTSRGCGKKGGSVNKWRRVNYTRSDNGGGGRKKNRVPGAGGGSNEERKIVFTGQARSMEKGIWGGEEKGKNSSVATRSSLKVILRWGTLSGGGGTGRIYSSPLGRLSGRDSRKMLIVPFQ